MHSLALFAYVPLLDLSGSSDTTENKVNQALTALNRAQAREAIPTTSPSNPAEEMRTLKVLQRGFESHLGYLFLSNGSSN